MPSKILQSGTTSLSVLKKGDFKIGVGTNAPYGPTSVTGFYNGIDPPLNGYTIYAQKPLQGPSINVASTDDQCIYFLKVLGATGSTIGEVLEWSQNQNNILVVNKEYDDFVTSGLTAYYDVTLVNSYPKQGTSWYDLSPNSYNLTLFNTPTFSSTGFSFSNTSFEYAATSVNLPDLNRWTIEAKFRVTSSLTGQVTSIVTGQYNLASKLNFSLGTNNAPTNYNLTVGFFDGSWRNVTGFAPSLNTWYHVIGTYNGSSIKMYRDGAEIDSTNYTGTPQSGGALRIARRWDSTNNDSINFFPGDIEFVRVYNRALSATEVTKNYNAQL